MVIQRLRVLVGVNYIILYDITSFSYERAFTVFLAMENRIYSICVLNTIPTFLTILDILNQKKTTLKRPT